MCMLILKRAYLLRSFHSQINDLIQLPLTKIKDGKSTWAHKWLRTWVTTINKLHGARAELRCGSIGGPLSSSAGWIFPLKSGDLLRLPQPWLTLLSPTWGERSQQQELEEWPTPVAEGTVRPKHHATFRQGGTRGTHCLHHWDRARNTGWTDDNLSSKKILPGFQLFGRIHRNQAVNFGYRWAIHPPFFPILFCLKPTSKCIDPVPCSMPCSMPNLQTCPGSSAMRVLYGNLVARSPRRAIGWWHLLSTIRGLDGVICSK